MWTISKTFRFEASHVLKGHDGKCARLHGHSWTMKVTLYGERLAETGPKAKMLVDYGEVKNVVAPIVDRFLDHHHLNETLDTDRPTSEFIAAWAFAKIKPILPSLIRVTIHETCTSEATYGV